MSRTDKDRPYRLRAAADSRIGRRWWTGAPPRWFINRYWSAPDRLAARTACLRARAEHRAGLVPDVDPPTFQHRHGARWVWN